MTVSNKIALVKVKDGLVNGLKTYYYVWSGEKAPENPMDLKPVKEDVSSWINYVWWNSPSPGIPSEFYAILWKGYIEVDKPGMYRFYLTTDDGSRLWIDDKLVIDAWKDQPPTTYVSKPIYLSRGYHKLKYYFYNRYGFAEAVLGWIPPDGESSVIPREKLFYCIGNDVFFTNVPNEYVIEILPVDLEKIICKAYKNICRIRVSEDEFPLEAIIRLYDQHGRIVYESRDKILIWGGDEFKFVKIK